MKNVLFVDRIVVWWLFICSKDAIALLSDSQFFIEKSASLILCLLKCVKLTVIRGQERGGLSGNMYAGPMDKARGEGVRVGGGDG